MPDMPKKPDSQTTRPSRSYLSDIPILRNPLTLLPGRNIYHEIIFLYDDFMLCKLVVPSPFDPAADLASHPDVAAAFATSDAAIELAYIRRRTSTEVAGMEMAGFPAGGAWELAA